MPEKSMEFPEEGQEWHDASPAKFSSCHWEPGAARLHKTCSWQRSGDAATSICLALVLVSCKSTVPLTAISNEDAPQDIPRHRQQQSPCPPKPRQATQEPWPPRPASSQPSMAQAAVLSSPLPSRKQGQKAGIKRKVISCLYQRKKLLESPSPAPIQL